LDQKSTDQKSTTQVSLAELAFAFLKLGTIAFGGPAAHIALMQEEFVRRRQWISEADFLDRLAAASLIPGPSSTEVAIFIGHTKRGWRGLIVAGTCFILPAAILVSLLAAAYVRYGSLPQAQGMLYAIKPVVIAIIIQALWSLGRSAIKTWPLALIAGVAVFLDAFSADALLLLVAAGLASGVAVWSRRGRPDAPSLAWPLGIRLWSVPAVVAMAVPFGLARLFFSFLKVGSVVFGSGYVLLAFLRAEFVEHLHWLTERQLIDAVTVGQFTPGPVFTTATFIGYLLAGIPGAVCATLSIFLPGFLLVAVSGPLLPKIRQSALAGAVLDGVVAGSLALMAVVTWQLGKAAIVDGRGLLICLTSLVALWRYRINSAWLIGAAAVAGWILKP
jgi:chromate transporter